MDSYTKWELVIAALYGLILLLGLLGLALGWRLYL